MSSLSTIVGQHVDAAVAEAGAAGFPADDVARTLLSFVMQIWREQRSPEQIADELKFVFDNLDPDEEYSFMRP